MNKNKKTLVAIFSSILMASLLCSPAFAVDTCAPSVDEILTLYTESNQLQDIQNEFVDPTVSQEILDSIKVSAFSTNALSTASMNTSADPEDAIYSVRNLGQVSRDNQNIGNMYAVTASTRKTEQDSTTVGPVYSWMTLVWIDHFGPDNELVSVSGGWSPNGVELGPKVVRYGVTNGYQDNLEVIGRPETNSFYYTGFDDFFGLVVYGRSITNYRENGETCYVKVEIVPTILD